ncbi:MAG TPA: aminotransferase class III-fold pyridoxal phosphate-dependent enzyme [Candidatus Limnocylindrales bacterium]|nr:aminotransferase class III-fold pyridoxal phosphate-dependent enzyme [Candidatus Limnocylindrales bacterium]
MVDTAPAPGATPLPDRSVVPAVWSRITNLIVDHGEGSWLVTPEGDRYLDYTSGIGVTNTGHAHPRVVAAVQAQAAKLLHGQQNIVYHEPGLRLYDRLAGLLPGGPWRAFLSNSGAEAVEAAVKLARVATGRPVIIGFRYAFHGRIGNAMALTAAKDVYRAAFEPLPGSIYHTAYPYCYRAPGGAHDPAACTCDWEEQLDLLFHQMVYPDKVAAIIVEPVIGEGGYLVPPPDFLPRLRELTRRHGILLIADEVQTGFGRTGELFAVRHWDVEPDILVMAKGIASGLPLSGILARQDLMERFAPGTHGGTYGGNVVSCAAANATLDVIEEEGLVANARERGAQFLDGLRRLQATHASIGDVRGLGLMVALEFVKPGEGDGRTPDAARTKRVQQACFDRGLLVLTAGTGGNVIRIIPPLVTTADEVDHALVVLAEALDAAAA